MTSPLLAAHAQWANRPDDERFLTLDALQASVDARKDLSHEANVNIASLTIAGDDDEVYMAGHNGKRVAFTNYAFGQFSAMVGAPAGYLRKLPAPVAALNLNTIMDLGTVTRERMKLLYQWPGNETETGQSRAFTSVTYGRIWDSQVVRAVQSINHDNRWHVPLQAYDGVNSTRATTLYASDHDVFIFLVDEARPIEIDGQTYYRGFYVWNSEVGQKTFGLTGFLYSRVCANRMIWNPRDVKELTIRHTSGGPDRFMRQAQPALAAMSDASPQPIIDAIKVAKATKIGKTVSEVTDWLARKGFARFQAAEAITAAAAGGTTGSSGDPTSLWDIVQGGTAMARDIKQTDRRLAVEQQWSDLLPEI